MTSPAGHPFAWQRLPRWRLSGVDRIGRPWHDYFHAATADGSRAELARSWYWTQRGAIVRAVEPAQ